MRGRGTAFKNTSMVIYHSKWLATDTQDRISSFWNASHSSCGIAGTPQTESERMKD